MLIKLYILTILTFSAQGQYHGTEFDDSAQNALCDIKNLQNTIGDFEADVNRTCYNNSDCQNFGTCTAQVNGGRGLCKCLSGTGGDLCQTVEECAQNPTMCGDDVNIQCVYSVPTQRAICLCEKSNQRFDSSTKTCRDCDCGTRGVDCYYIEGQKVCTCLPGYVQGSNGQCRIECNTHTPCRNGGECINGYCKCKTGMRGYFCEYISCNERGLCAKDATCIYDPSVEIPICKCKNSWDVHDYDKKFCKECFCGQHAESCSFDYLNSYKKKCHCKDGYAELRGICSPCSCGIHGAFCSYDDKNNKICLCDKGFAPLNEICIGCDCDVGSTKCNFNELGLQNCTCKEGYESIEGTCLDIDECLDSTVCPAFTNCQNTEGSYRCECKEGFRSANNNGCTDIDECTESVGQATACPEQLSSDCINTPGSYFCICKNQYFPYTDDNGLGKNPALYGCQVKRSKGIEIGNETLSNTESPFLIVSDDQQACSNNGDCKNYGECQKATANIQLMFCNCPKGTSGDFCEVIDECVANPGFCGYRTDAKCVYNFQKGRANCLCDDKKKKFDFMTLHCRRTCTKYEDCAGINGCVVDSTFGNKFCQCEFGFRGDFCETQVDECKEQGLDCESANATCDKISKQAKCMCQYGFRFDSTQQKCRRCDCGSYYTLCDFYGGKKFCWCNKHYYFSEVEGICKKCQCDAISSEGCKLERGKEICLCRENQLQKDFHCQMPCTERRKCSNGGFCRSGVCHCLPGFSGDYCEEYTDCKKICGSDPDDHGSDHTCVHDERKDVVKCVCGDGRQFNEVNNFCQECDCGIDGVCLFDAEGNKICQCYEGYKEVKGKCRRCNCGSMSLDCNFNRNDAKICFCKKGYEQKRGICLR